MLQPTMDKLYQMKLFGMAQALEELMAQPQTALALSPTKPAGLGTQYATGAHPGSYRPSPPPEPTVATTH